jgi:RNA polymerase sigma-70 factor (family 1)
MLIYSTHSDQLLMELIRQDDRLAFDELYQRHWPKLYLGAFNICRDREICMDICQEVFIWFWEHRQRASIINSVQGYLFAAIKFKIISHIRKGKVKESFFDRIKKLPDSYNIDDYVELKELQSIISQFTDELPEKCGEIFKLSRNQYMSNKEIAEKLNISEKTVENQITIALRKLKGSLGRFSCWLPLL